MSVLAPQPTVPTERETPRVWPAIVERWDAGGKPLGSSARAGAGLVVVCEHASNSLSDPWADLGLAPGVMGEHIAWDPGALGLARGLASRMAPALGGAVLVHAPLSRLIYDLNRAPDLPGAMPVRSERHDIPGNSRLSAEARAARDLARIVAPIAGTVLKLHARPGERVPEDGLLELADLSALDVVAEVYETDLPRVRTGASAQVFVPGTDRAFAARVVDVGWRVGRQSVLSPDPVASIDSRVVEVRLRLDASANDVLRRRTNMQVQVSIQP